ncbi:ketoacyl-synt-domain-containing protein [Aaosphaeria arxii CBS 175.79]|uniref:Ketoacyl-synt-domain-containing protein n=1 Tax=Aaosphaeria arxii CBS 175.79 TaxID=1450172 RepID=A0A6A5X7E4_9PLEO|nr:ketoacyl-synt-domain-containing protein [Aaosphaeria arxii CBS 175.79]KAF2008704.1 ketoacyl-synt-domain-containing protein [Aaosphaeria arxii CBS 175.79]
MVVQTISAAFFCPQGRAPPELCLVGLQSFLQRNPHGECLLQHVARLDEAFQMFCSARDDIRSLPKGSSEVRTLMDWAAGGSSAPISQARSGIIALPLLLILQLGQYLRYLEIHSLSHSGFVEQVQHVGGIQGYCGGAAAALSIACAKDEAEVIQNAAVFLRLLVGIGACIEAADYPSTGASTVIACRLKYEGQGDELVARFPGTYVSAVTEPRSISIAGNATILAQLFDYAHGLGLPVQQMEVTGKAHCPDNVPLAAGFLQLWRQTPSLQLPKQSELRVSIRSNRSAKKLEIGSVIEDLIVMIIASRCEWYQVLTLCAEDMKASGRRAHSVVTFGLNDCVPLAPFNKQRLEVSKILPPYFYDPKVTATPTVHEGAIAIVGASCRLPGATNLEELWDVISSGKDCHKGVPTDRFDIQSSSRAVQSGNEAQKIFGNFLDDVKGFDRSFFGMNAREAANLDPQQRILLELSYEALDSSGYLVSHVRERGDLVGCFIGANMIEYLDNTNAHAPSAYTSTGTLRAFLCGRLSHQYGWTAPSEVIDTACSSSLVAISRACNSILSGECDMALAGGVNIITGVNNFLDLGKAGFLSPTGQCKPFDDSADGYCRSDGAGLVVLKRLTRALEDGDQILGVISGIATNQGGLSSSLTIPSSDSLQALFRNVLQKADFQPSNVTFVEAHGTGTQAGDPIEMDSIRSIFGSSSRTVPITVGSIKGNIGHCESGAGVAGLLKVLAMIKHGKIPPQANHKLLNRKIPPLDLDGIRISEELLPWNVPLRAACVNSYGAAGSNCALLCHEMPTTIKTRPPPLPHPVLLSSASDNGLVANIQALVSYLERNVSKLSIADVAFTLNERRKKHRYCISTTATDVGSLIRSLESVQPSPFQYPDRPTPVVLLLSGQYDNKVALDPTCYKTYPALKGYIDNCDSILLSLGYPSIQQAIIQTEPIADVVCLQCSIFAMEYAWASLWINAGIKPAAIIGHSLGELIALAVSGALSLKDALNLVAYRAHLISTRWGTDCGSMLVLNVSATEAQATLPPATLGHSDRSKLDIACYNGPSSTVVAGSSSLVQATADFLAAGSGASGIISQQLSTTHAFHSSLTEPILPWLQSRAESLAWNEPIVPVEFCTHEHLDSISDWSAPKHAREPVYFFDAVRRVERRLGPSVWLEAGVNTPIVAMTKRAVANPDAHLFQSVRIKIGESMGQSISTIISKLWRHGLSVSYSTFFGPSSQVFRPVWLPPYQFERQSYWVDNIDRTTEARKQLPLQSVENAVPPKDLVFTKESPGSSGTTSVFYINTQSLRYQRIVQGHAVLGQPLCPASLYMECATMALQILRGQDIESHCLNFENLDFSAPLGLDSTREVILNLELHSEQAWNFTVQSTVSGSSMHPRVHCTGRLALTLRAEVSMFGRLVANSIQTLLSKNNTERLMSKRAYDLFSHVVTYDPSLQGILSIVLDKTEALAIVKHYKDHPDSKDSTAWHRCDAVTLDTFISVAGLLLNSSDTVSRAEAMVAVGLDRTVLSSACSPGPNSDLQVFVNFSLVDSKQATGDVFVCSQRGEVLAIFSGVRFHKVAISKLQKSLASANPSISTTQRLHPVASTESDFTDEATFRTPTESHFCASVPSDDEMYPSSKSQKDAVQALISTYTGLESTDISEDSLLMDLGFDSLSSIEFATELSTMFKVTVDSQSLGHISLRTLYTRFGLEIGGRAKLPVTQIREESFTASPTKSAVLFPSPSLRIVQPLEILGNPLNALDDSNHYIEDASIDQGFAGYWNVVAPLQNDLLIAYLLEAFRKLNLDLLSITPQNPVPAVKYLPRHEKLMSRIWWILEKHHYVEKRNTVILCSQEMPNRSVLSSSSVYDDFVQKFPRYLPEAKLIRLVGERLAECLKGEEDPIALLFGNAESSTIMEEYYSFSPMLSTMTQHLVTYLMNFLGPLQRGDTTIRILEIGAGTGGTTIKLAEALGKLDITCEYTFTDISPRLVSKAKSKFSRYPWMRFAVLDLENHVKDEFKHAFDIVISTNCVHATSDRERSCRRIWDTLTDDGIVILSEVTKSIDWFDMCFGVLEGWWLAGRGSEHPLQSTAVWMAAFKNAGFLSLGFSQGSTLETNTQQLLVGCKRHWPSQTMATPPSDVVSGKMETFELETMIYKDVSGIQIEADVYLPGAFTSSSMPIALMIHGGGHMALSRKAIRPAQTRYLLANGFLPVSIDYRLCPEVNLVEGPFADVRDGYWWARSELPLLLLKRGIMVDSDRVVVIGWSTGGHLAMSLGWTTREACLPSPTAILCFYTPVDFEFNALDNHRRPALPRPQLSISSILKTLPKAPLTKYETSSGGENNLGWLRSGDLRSELLLSVFSDGIGLPLLLNGLSNNSDDGCLETPAAERIADISPLARLQKGHYDIPTFMIHGKKDEIAPFVGAERFVAALRKSKIRHGFLELNTSHVHDLELVPGMKEWEEQVAPGYQFLFEVVQNAASQQ